MQTVQADSQVTLRYVLRLENDQVVDATQEHETVTIRMGQGELVAGLEQALLGMAPGEHKVVNLPPAYAYGEHDPSLTTRAPRSSFPAELELEPGQVLSFDSPQGEVLPATILEVGDTEVVVDFNHPLAGLAVEFEVTVVGVA